jgi:hypothetical protein
MSELQFKKRMTKKAFEQKFMEVVNGRDCHVTPHDENGWEGDHPTVTHMHLYYIEEAHAATWCKGQGWIFSNEQIEKNIKDVRMLEAMYPDLSKTVHSDMVV